MEVPSHPPDMVSIKVIVLIYKHIASVYLVVLMPKRCMRILDVWVS